MNQPRITRPQQGRWAAIALFPLVTVACTNDASHGTGTTGTVDPSSTVAVSTTTATTTTTTTTTTDTRPGGQHGPGPLSVDGDGTSHVQHDRMQDGILALPLSKLSDADRAGLIRMRDEERLAHDVLEVFSGQWKLPVFTNIAGAEATHTDAVMLLLERYDLADPAATAQPGTFQDPILQQFYDRFIAQGAKSVTEAMMAAASIEELDIFDLRARATDAADVDMVYTSLEEASRNHLEVFVAELTTRGVTYVPQFLSQADYEAIISQS